ncbi:MAG: ankyrin repeat domain-containing protein [Planctomycetota bacterium]
MPDQPRPTRSSRPVHPSTAPRVIRPMPDRPDLNQLKKQAKELLQNHKARQPAAVEEVKRFFHVEADHTLMLSEAQLVLARAHGYDSWPKLKAYVDGVNKQALVEAINAGDWESVRGMLRRRPELAAATTGQGEQQMIHLAVLREDVAMARLLMEHGADARRGIWPHRESTTALRMATERGLDQVVTAIEEVERQRQEELSCPNTTVSPEQDELARLIRAGECDEAIAMLEAQTELMKQCDRDGATPLHLACDTGDEALVDWLCDHRADARKVDAKGDAPIDRAVMSIGWPHHVDRPRALRVMRRLKQRGCETTAWAAAALGDVDRLRELYAESPASFALGGERFGNRGAVLTRAAQFGELESVRCLLDLGLDPDEPLPLGRESDDEEAVSWGGPLCAAAEHGEMEVVRLLLERGADANANIYAGGWPLDRAYGRGDRAMVELLFEYGAEPSPYTVCNAHDYATAERLFAERGHEPAWVRELVWSAGCCIALPIVEMALPRFMELRPLMPPDDGGLMSSHDLLHQPMRLGKPTDHVRPAGYRHDDRFKILELMLDAGIDPNVPGYFGLTVLHWVAALFGGDGPPTGPTDDGVRFATLLLDAGADPMLRDDLLCSTALGWACRYGRAELVELLLERGVPIEEPETPAWAQPRAWAKKMGQDAVSGFLRRGEA